MHEYWMFRVLLNDMFILDVKTGNTGKPEGDAIHSSGQKQHTCVSTKAT